MAKPPPLIKGGYLLSCFAAITNLPHRARQDKRERRKAVGSHTWLLRGELRSSSGELSAKLTERAKGKR